MVARAHPVLALMLALHACAADTSPDDAYQEGAEPDFDDEALAMVAQPPVATTRLVKLRSASGAVTRTYPVILTAVTPRGEQPWSSAFRLLCSDCKHALEAFGYSSQDGLFAAEYETLAALRADNQVPPDLPILDVAIEEAATERAVLAAFRVVDASDPADPRYLVRLRAAPEQLYATTCENFLRVAHGSLETTPINKSLLRYWGVPARLPVLGCASIGGKVLPAPAPAPSAAPARTVSTIVEVWTSTRPTPDVPGASAYPYIVTEDAAKKRRGFPVDCGSEARTALRSLGIEFEDIRPTPATAEELEATSFGNQPTIRCGGIGGGQILAISSANDPAKKMRFKFDDQRDIVEFSCQQTESYWSSQAASTLEVPYQSLRYLSDFESGSETNIFTIGCRNETPVVTDPPKPPEPKPDPRPPEPPRPPRTRPLARPGQGCVYEEFCDYPDHSAGTVCRTYQGCALDAAAISECRSEAVSVCGRPAGVFWICNADSSNCRPL